VRDSASSLEAGQHLGRASGSPDWKRLGSGDDAEEDEDGKKKRIDETEVFRGASGGSGEQDLRLERLSDSGLPEARRGGRAGD
jgi:hypothetical protein